MSKKDLDIARELKRKLMTIAVVVDFAVFGSRARGDADEYSDLDIFIAVESLTREQRKEISRSCWETGLDNSLVISPVVITRNDLENTPLRASPLVESVQREGIRV